MGDSGRYWGNLFIFILNRVTNLPMKKLAVITTHPVQYNVPWLIRLADRGIDAKVYYTYEQSSNGEIYDKGFGKDIKWDIPLLEGYSYEFVPNTARRPGLDRYLGIFNPT